MPKLKARKVTKPNARKTVKAKPPQREDSAAERDMDRRYMLLELACADRHCDPCTYPNCQRFSRELGKKKPFTTKMFEVRPMEKKGKVEPDRRYVMVILPARKSTAILARIQIARDTCGSSRRRIGTRLRSLRCPEQIGRKRRGLGWGKVRKLLERQARVGFIFALSIRLKGDMGRLAMRPKSREHVEDHSLSSMEA